MFQDRDNVRVKANAGKTGYIIGRKGSYESLPLWSVQFATEKKNYFEDQLELLPPEQDPIEDINSGRLGKVEDLRRCLTQHRLSGKLDNLIYSMSTTHTDFYAYQFKPVLKMLNTPRNGLLIADEVGLGKTIEAGLIWTELKSRFDFRRLFVLCPAILREKWYSELKSRFGVKAQIATAKYALDTFNDAITEGATAAFHLISSMQGLRPGKDWSEYNDSEDRSPGGRLFRFLEMRKAKESLIDLLIIDEAHYLRNKGTVVSKLGKLLRDVSEHVLLLSATPVHLRSRDLFHLLNLLDDDTFSMKIFFDQIIEANEPLVTLRDALMVKSLSPQEYVDKLCIAAGNPLLAKNRRLRTLIDNAPDDISSPSVRSELAYQLDRINLLSQLVTRTRKREVIESRVLRNAYAESVELNEPERKLYDGVTTIIRQLCSEHLKHEGFLLVMPQRQMASCMPAAFGRWLDRKRALNEDEYRRQAYEDFGYDDEAKLPGPVVQKILAHIDQLGNYQELRSNDSKFCRLLSILKSRLRDSPSVKVVLFSTFRPTLDYLHERLEEEGIPSIVLKGGVDKWEVINVFSANDGPNVLLSSEVGSEGIDLQFCHFLINYDLPWNPMRVEQRIGRLDRLGQKSPNITIWNLFAKDTIDSRIYLRLFERLDIFKRTLGDLEAVLGDEIQKLTIDLLSEQLTPLQEEQRIEQSALALENRRKEEEQLEDECSSLMAHGDYILNHIQSAKDQKRWIDGNDLSVYVRDFLSLYKGCRLKPTSDTLVFDIVLSDEPKQDLANFVREFRLQHGTRLTTSETPIRCRFENRVGGAESKQIEVINQFHPLIRFISNHAKTTGKIIPVVSIIMQIYEGHSLYGTEGVDGDFTFIIQKWKVEGIQPRETLYYSMRSICNDKNLNFSISEQIINCAILQGKDWPEFNEYLDSIKVVESIKKCEEAALKNYEKYSREVTDENNDRADVQVQNLKRHLETQSEKYESIKAKHEMLDREALAKATEGTMRALKSRVNMKLKEIERHRLVDINFEEVAIGVLRVELLNKI